MTNPMRGNSRAGNWPIPKFASLSVEASRSFLSWPLTSTPLQKEPSHTHTRSTCYILYSTMHTRNEIGDDAPQPTGPGHCECLRGCGWVEHLRAKTQRKKMFGFFCSCLHSHFIFTIPTSSRGNAPRSTGFAGAEEKKSRFRPCILLTRPDITPMNNTNAHRTWSDNKRFVNVLPPFGYYYVHDPRQTSTVVVYVTRERTWVGTGGRYRTERSTGTGTGDSFFPLGIP